VKLTSEEMAIYARHGIPLSIVGIMKRYEAKMKAECKRGRRYGPYLINGRKYRKRKFHASIREWNRWSFKHNRLAIGIQYVTGYWWRLPNECNSL